MSEHSNGDAAVVDHDEEPMAGDDGSQRNSNAVSQLEMWVSLTLERELMAQDIHVDRTMNLMRGASGEGVAQKRTGMTRSQR
jgi:hypothetical protein